MTKLDKRRKYYLILDCETATLPFAEKYGENKKKISIAKPLIYDLGWQIVDIKGNVYKQENFLISEIFSVPAVFNTAYYKDKRPIYLEKLRNKEIVLTDWNTAIMELENDLQVVESVGAYNSMFDFKKAIPFTELYIQKLYSDNYYKWEKGQEFICDEIASGRKRESNKVFEQDIFRFRGGVYPLFDVWGLACKYLLNNNDFRSYCMNNDFLTESRKFYKTSAEVAFRFLMDKIEFIESHTALDDAIIESEIFSLVGKITKHKFDIGIIYFPFRMIGKVEVEV